MSLPRSQSTSGPNMESDYFDEPPSYAGSIYSRRSFIPSPSYSLSPRQSELVIRTSSEATFNSAQDYIHHSKHIRVDLGSKLWGTNTPVYGGGASVEGSFTLSRDLKSVSSVCVKLEGAVTNTYTDRGLITGSSSVNVLSLSSCVTSPSSGDWTKQQYFSLKLPETAMGRCTPLPPTSILYSPGVTCTVKYRLKVTIVRKGFHRNDSLEIPFLYLPRTFARGPILFSVPDILSEPSLRRHDDGLGDVHTLPLKAWSKNRSLVNAPAIILVLPSVLSFALYDTIPLTLSILSTQNPAIVKLLFSTAKVQLIKRTRTWLYGGRNTANTEFVQGIAKVVSTEENGAGNGIVSYELRPTRPTVQRTWALDGVVEQQYYIRATIHPPTSAAAHIPNYGCEQLIEITTDAYESPEREAVELGGSPSPAIGTLGVGFQRSNTDAYAEALLRHGA